MRVLLAILFSGAIIVIGLWVLSAIGRNRDVAEETPVEDVADLEVSFVCGECGTELRVQKLGELQVPRHCGEPMEVVRG